MSAPACSSAPACLAARVSELLHIHSLAPVQRVIYPAVLAAHLC